MVFRTIAASLCALALAAVNPAQAQGKSQGTVACCRTCACC
jgi:hypothetical protein